MKKQLLSVFFILFFLSFSANAQVGLTFDNPIEITSLPYSTTDNTGNYGNNFISNYSQTCFYDNSTLPYAINGNDVFYDFVAPGTGMVSIAMTPSVGGTGIWILSGTYPNNYGCDYGKFNGQLTTRTINLYTYQGGHYPILISGSNSAGFFDYTLTISRDCTSPDDIGLYSLTTTTANLVLNKGYETDSQWEILLIPSTEEVAAPPADPLLEEGMILFPYSSNEPEDNIEVEVTNLVPGTKYYYFIRTICSSTEKSSWSEASSFTTILCNQEDKCSYMLYKTGSTGYGWQNGKMQIKQNGLVVEEITHTGTTGYEIIYLCDQTPFEVYWSVPGGAPQEVGLVIQNPHSDIIYNRVPGETQGPLQTLFTSVANHCAAPTCIKPSELSIIENSITLTSAELTWSENGNANQWEVYIVPKNGEAPSPGSPLGDSSDYYITEVNSLIVSNLQPATRYKYYVRALCSTNDFSAWTIANPKHFVTKSLNDECQNAIAVVVNSGIQENLYVSGSTLGSTASAQDSTCPGSEDDDVWFTFVADSNSCIIEFKNISGNSTNINHSLFSGECETMTQIYCSNTNASFATNLIIGNTYKIRVFTAFSGSDNSSDPSHATFDLYVTASSSITNDECNVAVNIPISESLTNGTSVSGALLGATASTQASTCIGTEDDDVWYKFVATSTKHLIHIENVQGSSNDLVHSVIGGECENFTQLYCSDYDSSTAENLIIGNEYKIRVWSKDNGAEVTTLDIIFDIAVIKLYPPLVANTTQFTNEQLVTNILVNNPCVDISNITSSTGSNFGGVNGIGYFTNTNPWFSIDSGIVLSTGNAANVGGPNTSLLSGGEGTWDSPDVDLEALFLAAYGSPLNSMNVTKLEFDFTSQNEFMSFNFLFASEEYGTFQCAYADAFAFLLTDLVTGVTTNLAVVPGTADPVSVMSIRDSTYNPGCVSVNSDFFDTFFGASFNEELSMNSPTNLNGQTNVMSASSGIIPNNPYHIKLVIADKGDTYYDSAVFIQAGSFSSGPPQCNDKVQLVAFIDANNNGIKEETESSFTYGSFIYQLNNAGDINNISSPIGNYTIYDENPLNSYDFSYEVHPEYATYFSAGTINHSDISIAVGSGTQTLYFPITQIQGYNDVTVAIVPVGQPTAGFSYTNKIVYTNLGTAATSGTITYTKDTAVTISSSQPEVVATADGFTFDFSNLAPYETRSFNILINVPSIPVVNIDDVLESSVAISAPENDINLNNNTYINSQIVVASYDPNDKMEAHGEKLDINNFSQDDYLFYTIRFQNTGTANAINIRIEDVLDAQLDEESIRMISASHNYVMERVGDELVWKFDYIYLPSILENEELSNGYLTFKIKVKPGFEVGDIIPNFAEIYFDTNPAIITNTFTSTFEEQLGTPEFTSENLLMYPNPSNGMVYINTQNTTENLKEINLYDVLGKIILSAKNLSSKHSVLNVAPLAKGVYMVEITTENNFKQTKKLVVN